MGMQEVTRTAHAVLFKHSFPTECFDGLLSAIFFVWELKRYYFLLKLKFSGGSLKNMHLHDAAWSSIESTRFARGCNFKMILNLALCFVSCLSSIVYFKTCPDKNMQPIRSRVVTDACQISWNITCQTIASWLS